MGRAYIYPPYPDQANKIAPDQLASLDRTKQWVCQRKFGGSRAVIKLQKDPDVCEVFDRHGGRFVTLTLTGGLQECLLGLNLKPGVEYWLDGEWLDKKAKVARTGKQAVQETIVLFDILYAGRYLTAETQVQRLALLDDLAPAAALEPGRRAWAVAGAGTAQLWRAEVFETDFEYRFYEFYELDGRGEDLHPEIEGVILRRRGFRLSNPGFTEYRVRGDVLRCRKPGTVRNF